MNPDTTDQAAAAAPVADRPAYGKIRNGSFHKITPDLDRAWAFARLSGADRRLLQFVREQSWGTRRSDEEPVACRINLTRLADAWDIDRRYLSRQLSALVHDGMLIGTADGFLIGKDILAWKKAGRIDQSDVDLVSAGYSWSRDSRVTAKGTCKSRDHQVQTGPPGPTRRDHQVPLA